MQMPQTEKEMLQITGVTEANYKRAGGKCLLEVTQRYSREKEGKKEIKCYYCLIDFVYFIFLFKQIFCSVSVSNYY